jgi:hypothetical protein
MPTAITRLAPQAILLAVVLYWCWPSLQEGGARTAPVAEKTAKTSLMADFSASSLSPTFPPPPTRNPFGPPGPMTARKGRGRIPTKKEVAERMASDAKDSGLVLKGTCIIGQQRLALINDRVYREKDVIQGGGEEPINWVITDILPHKVFLSCQGMPLQLTYSNTSPKPAARKSAGDGNKEPKRRIK